METIILAAGQSSRMGSNKALLEINGKIIIDIILAKLVPISRSVYLILGENYNQVKEYLSSTEFNSNVDDFHCKQAIHYC